MKSLGSRLGKLESTLAPKEIVGPVIYTFWARGDTGPQRTGGRAAFPGFADLQLEQSEGEDDEAFDNRAVQAFQELLDLKKLPEPESAGRIEAKITELLEFENAARPVTNER